MRKGDPYRARIVKLVFSQGMPVRKLVLRVRQAGSLLAEAPSVLIVAQELMLTETARVVKLASTATAKW